MITNGTFQRQRVVAIIQARLRSTRLPGKALLDLAGKPLLAHVIERSCAIEGVSEVVLATGTREENLPLADLAGEMGIEVFFGSEDNVLERYSRAADKYQADFVLRITGDNPFTDHEYASMITAIAVESGCDLCSISNIPLGTAVEVIRRDALNLAWTEGREKYHCEHVTPYMKEHTEIFRIERHPASFTNPFPGLRLTVDTPEDYKVAKAIYEALYRGTPFSLESVIAWLIEHPEIVTLNRHVQQRPMTQAENG